MIITIKVKKDLQNPERLDILKKEGDMHLKKKYHMYYVNDGQLRSMRCKVILSCKRD
jgi:hypothetical protein